MPRLRYDSLTGRHVPVGPATNHDRATLMRDHDALPVEWRELSRLIKGRAVINHHRRGLTLVHSRVVIFHNHGATTL